MCGVGGVGVFLWFFFVVIFFHICLMYTVISIEHFVLLPLLNMGAGCPVTYNMMIMCWVLCLLFRVSLIYRGPKSNPNITPSMRTTLRVWEIVRAKIRMPNGWFPRIGTPAG